MDETTTSDESETSLHDSMDSFDILVEQNMVMKPDDLKQAKRILYLKELE